MTKPTMDLSELLAKHDQGDFLRGIAEAVLQLIMEIDVDGLIGAGQHERSGERTTWRNGYMSFPRQHRTKLHSTNPIERLSKEVKRRADVVGIFPNEASIMRLIGAVLFEQNDEWQTSSRYMMVEAFAQIDKEEVDPILSITTKAA